MSRKRIYLDYAATTPLDPRVRSAMEPFFTEKFGNPRSIHAEGVAAKKAVDEARVKVARCLEAHADEIVFTSGGTEANNLALLGVIEALADRRRFPLSVPESSYQRARAGAKPHVVTTNIEHSSLREPLRELERQGRAEVTYVPVEPNGMVRPEKIIAAIRPNTTFVSVMYANNEIGAVQPIRKIAAQIKDVRFKIKERQSRELKSFNLHLSTVKNRLPIFHADACQAPLYLNCLVSALGVDLLTLDGHKMYGPKGGGCLYVRRGTPLAPQMCGGGQEQGLRSSTENVPGIVGFAEALLIAVAERKTESVRILKLRNHLYSEVLENIRIKNVVVNGSTEEGERLPNNLNISLPGTDTEMLTLQLDAAGIACSTKSSCLKDERESYVVAALGGGAERARATLRFTLGRATTKRDTDYAVKVLTRLLQHPSVW